jgi:hypothetical protein
MLPPSYLPELWNQFYVAQHEEQRTNNLQTHLYTASAEVCPLCWYCFAVSHLALRVVLALSLLMIRFAYIFPKSKGSTQTVLIVGRCNGFILSIWNLNFLQLNN